MTKSKLLSRSAFFFLALVLARPAWATGIGGNGVDEMVPVYIYVVSLSLAGYGGYALLCRRERRRASSSSENGEPFSSPLELRKGFFGPIQFVVTSAAFIGANKEFLPAVFFPILPLGYALVRRKHWLGLGLLVAAVVISLPFFAVLGLLMISVKFR